jgi:hypothetical protein
MTYTVQVTIDSTDPHALADWWAATLGWHVEASDETFIRQMISEGHATEGDTLMHRGALVWREGAAIHPADEQLPHAPRIYFQMVPESNLAEPTTARTSVSTAARHDCVDGRTAEPRPPRRRRHRLGDAPAKRRPPTGNAPTVSSMVLPEEDDPGNPGDAPGGD